MTKAKNNFWTDVQVTNTKPLPSSGIRLAEKDELKNKKRFFASLFNEIGVVTIKVTQNQIESLAKIFALLSEWSNTPKRSLSNSKEFDISTKLD